jgi:hypothetical protein
MSKMFRDALKGRIELCFSNLILREFIGRAPSRREQLELYKRYISVVAPRENLETCFWDLAAAINAIVIEAGETGDIKDTYSFVLATLAHIRYIVTEDRDIRRLYAYLTAARSKGYEAIDTDIKKTKEFFGTLSKVLENEFPIGNILERLYWGPIPTPVSVLDLKNALADVLTKTETILVMFSSLARIDLMIRHLQESKIRTPTEYDGKACEAARARIEHVAKCIGISTKNLKAEMFRVALVEKESAWIEDSNDRKLADTLGAQLEILQEILYPEEEEGYRSLEEQYFAEEPAKIYLVKCEECGKESEVETVYQGVVEVEQRSMGAELTHVWHGDTNCPSCKNYLQVEYTRWEYPEHWENFDELEPLGCSIVPEKSRDTLQSTLD